MEFLAYTFYGNSAETWLLAGTVAIVTFVVLAGVKSFVVRQLRALAQRTSNTLDDLGAAVVDRTKVFFLFGLSILAGAQLLLLPDQALDVLQALVFITLLLQIAIWGNAAITATLHGYTSRLMEEDAASATTLRNLASRSAGLRSASALALAAATGASAFSRKSPVGAPDASRTTSPPAGGR